MSYFHEYVLKERKTLRTYSGPVDLRRFPSEQWITSEDECWDVGAALTDVRHYPVATPAQIRLCSSQPPPVRSKTRPHAQ